MKKTCIVVPARLGSERFPNKILAEYKGRPIIEHILGIAKNISQINKSKYNIDIVLATDIYNEQLRLYTKKYGAKYFFMANRVTCGSERVKIVYQDNPNYDYYITLPADEPEINSQEISDCIDEIVQEKDDNTVHTCVTKFYNKEDLTDRRSCKIVIDQHFNILYTSRAVIPASKSREFHPLETYWKHVGVFFFPKKVLKKHCHLMWYDLELNPQINAALEGLEQNMFLGRDFKFSAIKIKHKGFGVDSPEQIKMLEERFGYKK